MIKVRKTIKYVMTIILTKKLCGGQQCSDKRDDF